MAQQFATVSVIGLGYIGLPTAGLLATKGFQVKGYDVNSAVVETINRGEIHITERDLDVLVRSGVNSGQLKAYSEPQPADVFIIAVPTPFSEGYQPDLSYIESALNTIAPVLAAKNLIILESTSPIGTTERIANRLAELRPDLQDSLAICHCPERVLPGHILRELVENDRLIGGINKTSTDIALAFYSQFVQGKLIATNSRTAELAKLVENAYRDVNIAFANELSLICDELDISVWELIELANRHPRVNILQPGPGVGGHCLAVDPWFIVDAAPKQAKLIRTGREVNEAKPQAVVNKVKEKASRFKKPVIACLGLAYKPNIDDLRESPAIDITTALAKENDDLLLVVEPYVKQLPDKLSSHGPHIELVNLNQAIEQADILVLLVDHDEFKALDRSQLSEKIVIDTRGIWR